MIGTGTMGAGMARSAKRAGIDVAVWNRTMARAEPLAGDGIEVADSVADAVTGADVVITILFDVDAVLANIDELTGALGPDAVWLQSSTVGPDGMARIAAAAKGVNLLDAPMLGTKKPAEEGNLVPLISGDSDHVTTVQPVLDAIGAKTIVAGTQLGQASALKLACNAWILSITAATAQSVALTQKQGLDPTLFLSAINGGGADSPYAQLKGKSMIAGDFTPSFEIDGGRKDAALIVEAAAKAGVHTAVFEQVKAAFDRASEDGHGDEDLSAVFITF